MNASEKHELYGLLEQLLEDRLDAAGQAQLAAMLANSTDARDLYRSYLELHADLMSATAVHQMSRQFPRRFWHHRIAQLDHRRVRFDL